MEFLSFFPKRNREVKKAKIVTPAWVSMVSSESIETSMITKNARKK
jgi:hypothetical protein